MTKPVKADWRVFGSILLVIFGMELVVMVVLRLLPPMPPLVAAFIDALALAILSAPLLWLIVAKPLALGAEAEKLRLEARVAGILQTSVDGILTTDARGIILQFNAGAEKIFGYTAREVVGQNIDLLLPERARTAHEGHVARFAAGPEGSRATGQDAQLEGRRKNGEIFPADISISKLAEGDDTMLTAVVRDATERTRAEADLHLQSTALNAAADPMFITDRDGTIAWINAAFTEGTGYSAEEAIGRNTRALLRSGGHDRAFYKELWDTILAGKVWRGEMTNRRKDGSLYPETQTITPVRNARGEISHFIAVERDLTKDKKLQAQFLQAHKMESVGRLAGGVAHDFNNLLSVIIGWTEMALTDLPADHPVRESLEEVIKAGEGAASLTTQLLAFSRQQLVEPTLFHPNDLVVETDKMLRRLIGEDIEMVTRTDPELGTVKMDRGQFDQVLMNLVVNARDAMPEGGKLTIETANVVLDAEYSRKNPGMTPGEYVMLAVSDSGVGMSDEIKTHIFEPFFTTKELGKGTGLGLATSYGIAKQNGGYIAVYSEEGLGTTMKLYLPRRREAAAVAARGRTRTPVHGVETILLVEDEPAVRRVTVRMLEAQGYRVLSTSSGEEALRVIEDERERLHLLLTDVVLAGGMSGPVLAERVRALRPSLKVLYVTGYTSDVTILHGLLEHSVALVQKPFTAESLGSKVRQVLDATEGTDPRLEHA
jgi:two-component system cell cycle sensor histidine kinase/response regulator CckA